MDSGKHTIVEVPLKRGPAGHLLIRVGIDDQAALVFLIDTGASKSVISASTVSADARERVKADEAEKVHAAGGDLPEARMLPVDRLTLGSWACRQIELTVLDLEHLTPGLGIAIDGILGLDVLARYKLCLDLQDNRLALSSATGSESVCGKDLQTFVSQPFRQSDDGLIILEVELNNEVTMSAILDLGAATSLVNGAAAKLAALAETQPLEARENSVALGADNRKLKVVSCRIDGVRIGAAEFPPMSVFVSDLPVFEMLGFDEEPVMLLGLDVLGDRVLGIDFDRRLFFVSHGHVENPRC